MSRVKCKCDKCELLVINGYVSHETGCPNQNKTWDKERQEWVSYHACHDCGYPVEDREICNCNLPIEEDENEY